MIAAAEVVDAGMIAGWRLKAALDMSSREDPSPFATEALSVMEMVGAVLESGFEVSATVKDGLRSLAVDDGVRTGVMSHVERVLASEGVLSPLGETERYAQGMSDGAYMILSALAAFPRYMPKMLKEVDTDMTDAQMHATAKVLKMAHSALDGFRGDVFSLPEPTPEFQAQCSASIFENFSHYDS